MNAVTAPTRNEDEAACARLCVDFVNHIDARRYAALLDLFTEDGALDRMGTLLSGRQEIARFLDSRPTSVATRHLSANISISFEGDDQATGFSYVMFFQGSGDAAVPVMTGAPSVVEYHDRYTRTRAGWRIQSRRIQMSMRAAAP